MAQASTTCSPTPASRPAAPRRHGHVPARARAPAARRTRSSRSTTTSSSRPDTFEGRVPAKFAERAPRVVEKDDGTQVWVYDGEEIPNVGFNAVVGRPVERVQLRADPVRRDAQRRVGHPRPHRRHGPQRRLRLAELPVVPPRLRRPAAADDARKDPELALAAVRAWNDWHLEEWAGAVPRPDHPVPAARTSSIPRSAAAGDPRATPSAGFKAVTFSEAPHAARPAVAAHGPLGPDHARRARRPAPS